MATVDGKPPRKADQLLQALSKKYEDKVRDREARSSGRNTPTRRTPCGSRERLVQTPDGLDRDGNKSSASVRSRSARASPIVSSDLFTSNSRAASLDALRSSRRSEDGSPAVRASPSLREKSRSPAARMSPVQSPGLLDRAMASPTPSHSRRGSPSPGPSYRDIHTSSPVNTEPSLSSTGTLKASPGPTTRRKVSERSHLFGRISSPTEAPDDTHNTDDHIHSLSEYGRSLKTDDYETELADLNTSQETTNAAANIILDASPDNSAHEPKPVDKYTPTKHSYAFGKNLRLGDKSQARGGSRSNEHRLADRSGDWEERPESRHSSLSNYNLTQQPTAISPRSSISPSAARSFALEKEHTDSQLRKLEVDNSTLKLENKSLKEKCNRAQSHIVHLETKVQTLNEEINRVRDERKKEMNRSRQRNAEATETLQESARGEKDEMRRQVELLKVENESLEKELAAARRMTNTAMQSSDISKVVSGYKVESTALREEIKALKLLLKEAENSLHTEAASRQQIIESNRKLTDLNNVLKQQLDVDSGNSVADKQVKGIESRLKITEDRLFQERADRASKLSEIEEKLLNENAKLHVDVKELSRQLHREQDKVRLNEVKVNELKEQQMSLNFLAQGTTRSRFSSIRKVGESKMSSEVLKIVEEIHRESGAQLHEEEQVIMYLHNKERAVMKQLNDWKNELTQLKDLHRQLYNDKDMRKVEEELQDARHLCSQVENELNAQVASLVKEKHQSMAAVKSGEDKIEALETELDYLRVQLKVGGGVASHSDSDRNEFKSERYVKMEKEVQTLRVKVSELERSVRVRESELHSVEEQLEGKSESLDEAVRELDLLRKTHSEDGDEKNKQQKRIDELDMQAKEQASQLATLKEKHQLLSQSKQELESKVEVLTAQVDSAADDLRCSSRNADSYTSRNSQLQLELSEKTDEVKVLKERYESLDGKHVEVREELILSKELVEKLQHQVNDLHQQLVAKSGEYEDVTSRLRSQESSYTSTEDQLLAAQKQVDELKTELSIEKLNLSKLKSDGEREAATHKHETSKQAREINSLTASLETLKTQKAELSKDVEVLKVKLAELQARLTESQSNLSQHREKEKDDFEETLTLSEERDRLTEEKHEAKLQSAKIAAEHKQETQELSRTVQELRQQILSLNNSLESAHTNSDFEKERMTTELEACRKQLVKKDQEIEALRLSMTEVKHEVEVKVNRVKELEGQQSEMDYVNKQQVEELNQALQEREQQLTSYKNSLKELDTESRTKKELEVKVRSLEMQLQESNSAELRLKKELAVVEEKQTSQKLKADELGGEVSRLEQKKREEVGKLTRKLDESNETIKLNQQLHEKERTTLQDKFNQVNTDLKAAEATIAVMRESKQTHLTTLNMMEKKKDLLKNQLQESQVNERLAEQKLSLAKEQLEEARNRMVKAEEKVAELSATVVRVESDLKMDKERLNYLAKEKEDIEGAKVSIDYRMEMCQKELEALESENSSLKEQLESQKGVTETRNRRQSEQHKTLVEGLEREKSRLQSANQDLSSAVERLKGQLKSSEDDCQGFKHKLLSLEQKLIETEARLSKSEQFVMSHDDMQERLNKRNLDLELELSELKNLLTRMEGNSSANELASSKIDNLTRADLNRTMSEWSSRLQTLLESKQKSGEMDSQLHDLSKMKVVELESKLKHEQLMHTVTKNQLKSLEDENMKLRKRILASGSVKRTASSRSREEMIREQILQSEMRVASQMGLPSNRLLGSTLLATSTMPRFGGFTTSPTKLHSRTETFSGMNLYGSLGFTSASPDRLNNSLSPDHSLRGDDST